MKISVSLLILASVLVLNGCGSSSSTTSDELSANEKLGKLLFFDNNISKTRSTNCSTCHDPKHGFIDSRYHKSDVNQTVFVNGALSVGDDGISLGGRNAPTAAYAMFSPKFGEKDGIYIGGQFHDGRAATLKDQAMGPPLDMAEMMMPNSDLVVERIKENKNYIEQFKSLYGEDIFDDSNKTFDKMAEAISDYEKTEEFAPFDSRFDRWVDGTVEFTEIEKKGFELFNSNKTNCRLCHTLDSNAIVMDKTGKKRELFTNYEHDNIGAPRNISAMNRRAELGLQAADSKYLGVGGVVNNATHYGKSKIPTLRNIAVTAPYMSNGKFQELRTVIEFYDFMSGKGTHNINKETGKVWGENDFPGTINYEELTQTQHLSDNDIDALIAFLETLTDKKYEYLLK